MARKKQKKRSLLSLVKVNKKSLTIMAIVVAIFGTVVTLISMAATDCPATSPCVQSGTDVTNKAWQLDFSDEFNGSSLDKSKWADLRGQAPGYSGAYNPSIEDAYFKSSNTTVGGGSMALTIKQEPANGYAYSTGVAHSGRAYSFAPGSYIESRMYLPSCDGCWPAFWTLDYPVDTRWPPEIDILEMFGTQSDKRPQFNYHWDSGGHQQSGVKPYGNLGDYTNSWHVYGMYWDGVKAIPYVDGVAYPSSGFSNSSAMVKANQYIIFNLAVQKGHRPTPGSQMLVDWVRVWKPGSGAPATPPPTTPPPATPPPTSPPPTTPTPTPTPPTTPTAPTTPSSGGSNQQTTLVVNTQSKTPQTVTGTLSLPPSTGRSSLTVTHVDGRPVDSSQGNIDTTKLTNGEHTITVASTEDGKKVEKKVKVVVANKLNPYQTVRNEALSLVYHKPLVLLGGLGTMAIIALAGAFIRYQITISQLGHRL